MNYGGAIILVLVLFLSFGMYIRWTGRRSADMQLQKVQDKGVGLYLDEHAHTWLQVNAKQYLCEKQPYPKRVTALLKAFPWRARCTHFAYVLPSDFVLGRAEVEHIFQLFWPNGGGKDSRYQLMHDDRDDSIVVLVVEQPDELVAEIVHGDDTYPLAWIGYRSQYSVRLLIDFISLRKVRDT